ncbi:t-SNARE affecting a late Golgi compartment protein 2 [[Candida] anglica]|uniref:t-SNARE affecting a late Golgi compartment protein 2 n=1 Tax=[Candida] anglica TaxID=148631 RepID=A0ABP0EI57_9ASCO
MYRDRTNLFLSYRRTAPRNEMSSTFSTLSEEEQGLMGSRRNKKQSTNTSTNPNSKGYRDSIEMKTLPPSFFDIASEIDDHLKTITAKISTLNSLYKKNLLPGFNDRTADDVEIDQLNYTITKTFQSCYVLVKKFEFLQKNASKLNYSKDEVSMIENLKKTYAQKIQSSSSNFRKIQNNYIKFLKEDEYESAPLLSSAGPTVDTSNQLSTPLQQQQQQSQRSSEDIESYSRQALQQSQLASNSTNEQYILQREQEISKLAMGVLEVSSIFREMESLIIDQGTILDRIDYNLASTVEDLKVADKELIQGSSYQKRTQKCKIIFLLSLIVFALLMIVLVKPHTRTVEKKVEVTKPSIDVTEPDSEAITPNIEDGLL